MAWRNQGLKVKAKLVFHFSIYRMRVHHVYFHTKTLQFADHIHHFGIAQAFGGDRLRQNCGI